MAERIDVGITIKGTQEASDSMNALDQGIKKAGSGMDGLIGLTDKFTGGAATGMINAYKGTLSFIKGLKLTKVALISTGIGAIVVLVGALVAAFMSSEEQAGQMKVQMAKLGAVVDRVKGYFKAAGGYIVGLFSGGPQQALENYNKEMDKLPGSMQDAIDAAMELERRLQALAEAQRFQAAMSAKAGLQAKRLLKQASDTNKTTEQRIALIEKANAIEMADFEKRKKNLKEESEIIKDTIATKGTSVELENKLMALYTTRLKMEEEKMNLTATGLNRIQVLKDADAAAEQKRIDDAKKAIDDQKVLDDEAIATQKAKDAAKLAAQIKLEDELYALSLSDFDRAELALQQEFDKRDEIAGDNAELKKAAEQRLIDDLAALQKKFDDDKAAKQKVIDDKTAADKKVVDDKKIAQELAVAEAIKSARMNIVSSSFDALKAMAKTEEQSKKLAIAQILVNQAIAMSNAIAGATTSATATGPGAFVATPLFIAQALGIVIGSFASIKGVMNQAGASAEGVGGGGGGGGGMGGGMGTASNRDGPTLGLTPNISDAVTPGSIPPINAYVVQTQLADQNALAAQIQSATTL